MKACLDNSAEFEEISFQVKSWKRESIDRSAAGLDGVVRIDLGRRSREIMQKGIIRAAGHEQLTEKSDILALLVDGSGHVLTRGRSKVMTGLYINSFTVGKVKTGGAGVWCEFEIIYEQVRVQL